MATVLTIAGENLIALKQAQGKTLNIDQFVLALIPGLDPNQPIDRFTTIPDTDKIKYTYAIPQDHKGYIAPNQVVYSMLLTSDVGDFDFNWVGLYSSEDKTLIAVIHLPELKKFKSDAEAGTLGNNLVRNVLLEFTGAKGTTNITVEASTWQIDFTARLKDIDERERLSNRDIYGAECFFGDAYLVTNKAGTFAIQPGTAYVEGVRIDLPAEQTINGESLPKSVYLDVCLSPHESTVRAKATPIYEDKPDYVDENNVAHYITKIADIAADGTVTDCRPQGSNGTLGQLFALKSDIATATTSKKGLVELATASEAKSKKSGTHAVTPKALVDFITQDTSTGAAILPAGTTSERPANPLQGMLRYNTSHNFMEWYNTATGKWLPTYTAPSYEIEYVVVAGGGPGGGVAIAPGGGGGAGGYRSSVKGEFSGGNTPAEPTMSVRKNSTVSVIVGAGGASSTTGGTPGGNSSLGNITSLGGAPGSGNEFPKGRDGGSGSGTQLAGADNRGHGTQGQGCDGGLGANYSSGAGGGASKPGGDGTARSNAGNGGDGATSSIDGTETVRAAGGGGSVGGNYYGGNGGKGGNGGGGDGSTSNAKPATAGAKNTGSGGGAGHQAAPGGSGIVLLRYQGPQQGTGGTVTSYTDENSQLWTVHTFTTSGVFTA